MSTPRPSSLLALDVGSKRIGLALASSAALLASPLITIERNKDSLTAIKQIIQDESVSVVIVGLPRGMEGQETAQTKETRSFIEELKAETNLPVDVQDEALTSRQAEEELGARNVGYNKGEVDALAATYILRDYITENGEKLRK